jgi:hypothetical protein
MKRILLATSVVLGICLILPVAAYACECCPDPSVKAEWSHHGWQCDEDVNDGSIVVTGTQRLLCWDVLSGTGVVEVRTKSGQDIGCYEPEGSERYHGCLRAGRHDLSSAWFCKGDPTVISFEQITVNSVPEQQTAAQILGASVAISVILAACVIAERGRRR